MNNPLVVTGATGAIGGAATMELARFAKNDLILVGRNESKLRQTKSRLNAINPSIEVDLVIADLSNIASTRKGIASIAAKTPSIAGLVNVASVYKKDRIVTAENLETMFATNHLGPFVLTTGLLDLLKKNKEGRIITVSAPSATKLKFDDLQGKNNFSALSTFGGSKMANLLFAFALSRRLEGSGVTSNVLHPGIVKSDLIQEMPGIIRFLINLMGPNADEAGRTLSQLMISPKFDGITGKFFNKKEKELKRPGYSGDEKIQDQLWNISERIAAAV